MQLHTVNEATIASVSPRRVAAITFTVALHLGAGLMLALPSSNPFRPPALPKADPLKVIEVLRVEALPTPPAPPMPQAPTRPLEPVPAALPTPIAPPQVQALPRASVAPTSPQRAVELAIQAPPRQLSEPSLAQLDYRERPPLTYPAPALRRGLEGEVLLRLDVDLAGVPKRAEIRRSSGHRELDRAAERYALQKLRFHPARIDGRAVAARADIPVRFNLPR
jgi:protein TonB